MNPDVFKPVFDYFGAPYPGAYMTILFFSFFMTLPIMIFASKRFDLSFWKMFFLPFVIVPCALVFSKIFHILFEGMLPTYIEGLNQNGISYLFTRMLNPFVAGHVFYGGLLGGFLAGALATVIAYPHDKKSFLKTADAASICVANGLWLTRIGCFFEGCCFGRPSQLFGIRFPQGSKTMFTLFHIDPEHTDLFTDTQPLIPTQLIHSFSNLVIFVVLLKLALSKNPKNPGYISAVFLLSYSVTRFLIEFLRYDIRGSFLMFSTSQWISIFLFIGGFILFKKTKSAEKI
ncbi:prolipoprotein diacylglyceryl transferase [bacterium]|nr:prolipoprotein diacylglyceryl transferase [bacterium]